MPYVIRKKGSQYEVVNKNTGRGHGKTTELKAKKQLRLLQGIEHGMKPRKKK